METKILDLINDFVYKLKELSSVELKDLKIVLPYENFKQLEFELNGFEIDSKYNPYALEYKLKLLTLCGTPVEVSCKKIDDMFIEKKLNQCFEILSK